MKRYIAYILLLVAAVLLLPAQGFSKPFTKDEIKEYLPKMLGATNVGREFYMTFIPCWETGGPNDVYIYVSSNVRTKVTVDVSAYGLTWVDYTIPNDIITFMLSPGPAQCYRKTDTDPPEPEKVYPGMAVHIISDDPIICYGVTRYLYTSDGFLVLPVNVLGKEYLVASWNDPVGKIQYLTSYTSVVGAYDRTKVRFTMGGNVNSSSAGGKKPGDTININLNAGDVFLIGAIGVNSDLTGSHVLSSKPVAVVSGNFCAYIPTECGCCDYLSEMELPTNTWGNTYHVTRIVNRLKNSMIRVFAKEPNTKVFRDGIEISTIRDVGGLEGEGWLSMRADSGLPRPIVISGDKPINVTQYNTGQLDDSVTSDPFQMVLTPVDQYQTEIIFNTPGIRGGKGFLTNYINICYQADDNGTIPDDFVYAEVINGKVQWYQLKVLSPSPGEEFKVKVKGKRYFAKTLQLPHDGVYQLRANAPFAAYSYGFAWCDSYGFPASLGLADLTYNDSTPPDPPWNMGCHGDVNEDHKTTVDDMPDDAEGRSNLGMIYMHTDSSFNYKLYYDDFIPGDDRSTAWWLEVIDKNEDARAIVTFVDKAGNDTTLIIYYYGRKLRVSPDYKNFGKLSKDTVVSKDFWLIHESNVRTESIDFIKFKKNDQGFEVTDVNGGALSLPFTMAPMDSVPFKIKFTAMSEGAFSDSIGVGDSCLFMFKALVEANVGPVDVRDDLSDNLYLNIFPNPSDGNSIVEFRAPAGSNVALTLYDIFGNKIGLPVNANMEEGMNRIDLNVSELPSGVYHLVLRAGADIITKQFMVVR